jgi:DNA-binding CsgD family transcriptional regulator
VIVDAETFFQHYGTPRHSGRYPWGSGGDPQRSASFLDSVAELKKQGLKDTEIAEGLGITTTQLRARKTIARNEQKQAQINMAQRLKDKGLSNVKIGERMGLNESSVRSLLAPGQKDKLDILSATSDMLREQVAEKKYIDIGRGVETELPIGGSQIGISKEKLAASVAILKEEGYTTHYVKIPQLGTNKMTTLKVLAAPGTPYTEVYQNRHNIKLVSARSDDHGRSWDSNLGIQTPISVSSKRVAVRYAEEGGTHADGVIYVRPGAKDLSLGGSRYAQVRIAVDGTHYLKGMAVYKDDLPAGVDLMFNTNKSNTGNKLDALKSMKDDPDNPFGAVVRQLKGPDGKVNSAMNLVNEEGKWDTWAKTLSSQVLSKQSPDLAKTQLNMTYERRHRDLAEIMSLTNPAVKKKLLESFADDADSAAVHLKAAALPRQRSQVILPVSSMKPTEIYAPNFKTGERVALIRFPHAGTFEIPELTVNNRNAEAKKLLGNAVDAVGINHKVAEHLSGADFDGDTVLVIPNNSGKLKSTPALEGLKGFDPQSAHPPYDGMRTIDGGTYNAAKKKVEYGDKGKTAGKQAEMGKITNLIADMTVRGAGPSDMARAVRHSMVVIDAEKHVLDYKDSAQVNGIAALKAKYQGRSNAGASTLITRAGSEVRVPERKLRPASEGGPIDPKTGKLVYKEQPETFVNRAGETVTKKEWAKRLAITDDAHNLVSEGSTPIERVYADHSNRLKALANTARKETLSVKAPRISTSAPSTHHAEVASLNAKLSLAIKNAPRERHAQVLANGVVAQKRQANPDMESADLKKIKAQALEAARVRTQAKKQPIEITEAEWAAIQAGAISNHKLEEILRHADMDVVRQLATPREHLTMTSTKKLRAQAMLSNGYTQAEVAEQLGVSLSTLKLSLKDGE